jgi:uncharacterized protein (DUF302 family)
MTAYAIPKDVDGDFDEVVERVRAALADEGFGILTVIDVKATMKEKLDEDVDPYVILGACNPQLAHRGLGVEPDLGVLLPCNVVVRQAGDRVRVAAMEPNAALALADNEAIVPIAAEARERITRAIEAL